MDIMEKTVNRPSRIAVTWHPSLEEAKAMSLDILTKLTSRSVDRADAFPLNDTQFRTSLKNGRMTWSSRSEVTERCSVRGSSEPR